MIKTEKIIEAKPYFIVCKFNNGEIKKLFVEPLFSQNKNSFSAQKILDKDFFGTVRVGDLGQLYWKDAATMKDENGNSISCEYDMSPEFVYFNSQKI